MKHYLDFEQPIAELEGKIEELRRLGTTGGVNISDEVERLQTKLEQEINALYAKLTPWQKTQVARHPGRPHVADYLDRLIEDFTPLAGDRLYGEDAAIIGGVGRFRGRSCVLIGQEKGHDITTRQRHNFGMPRPEGYRKAQRLMTMAARFKLPIVTLVDTPGAYPGIGAEERGQAEAIARCIELGLALSVPTVSVVIGEGGSGGAIALATSDRVLMLEHAIYSVISPEGCASILWRSADESQAAASALRLTAQDLDALEVIDGIVEEPVGAAHRDLETAVAAVGDAIETALTETSSLEPGSLVAQRKQKFLAMGHKGLT